MEFADIALAIFVLLFAAALATGSPTLRPSARRLLQLNAYWMVAFNGGQRLASRFTAPSNASNLVPKWLVDLCRADIPCLVPPQITVLQGHCDACSLPKPTATISIGAPVWINNGMIDNKLDEHLLSTLHQALAIEQGAPVLMYLAMLQHYVHVQSRVQPTPIRARASNIVPRVAAQNVKFGRFGGLSTGGIVTKVRMDAQRARFPPASEDLPNNTSLAMGIALGVELGLGCLLAF